MFPTVSFWSPLPLLPPPLSFSCEQLSSPAWPAGAPWTEQTTDHSNVESNTTCAKKKKVKKKETIKNEPTDLGYQGIYYDESNVTSSTVKPGPIHVNNLSLLNDTELTPVRLRNRRRKKTHNGGFNLIMPGMQLLITLCFK